MSRLIIYDKEQKRYFHKFSTDGFNILFQKVCAKLYDFEDLMEKYEIEDLVELEIALDQYYHRYDKVETRRVDSDE